METKAISRKIEAPAGFWMHFGVLALGFFIGIAAVYFLGGINIDFSGDVREARRLGIVSITILAGYSKMRDVFTYALALCIPTLFSLGLWLLWAGKGRRAGLAEILAAGKENIEARKGKDIVWTLCLLAVIFFYLIYSFNVNYFLSPRYDLRTGSWVTLGEEGEVLAWVQSILSGGAYGKDFFCLYGPMLIYPLVWLMKLLGTSIVIERLYTFLLNLAAYGIIIAFLYKTIRSRIVFVVAGLVYFAVYQPYGYVSPNMSYLRVAAGFLPVLLVYLYSGNGKKSYLWAAGLVLGQSLLFSQEVGLCSLFSSGAFIVLENVFKRDFKRLKNDPAVLLMSCLISAAPMLFYLHYRGGLGYFIDSWYKYPKYVTMGYGCLPFPGFNKFIESLAAGVFLVPYQIIFVYVFSAIYLLLMFILGKADRALFLRMSLLIFGALLFRSALGRSDNFHIMYSAQPAFLLAFLFIDGAAGGLSAGGILGKRIGETACLAALGLFLFMNISPGTMSSFKTDAFNFSNKWKILDMGYRIADLERGGIFFEEKTTYSLLKLRKFLDAYTKKGDFVYFFPNEPAYYFLFDMKNPTRYAMSYFAVTSEQRQEIINDLRQKKPEYVVYSRNTWRIDDIPEQTQVPELTAFISDSYQQFMDLGDILILSKTGAGR